MRRMPQTCDLSNLLNPYNLEVPEDKTRQEAVSKRRWRVVSTWTSTLTASQSWCTLLKLVKCPRSLDLTSERGLMMLCLRGTIPPNMLPRWLSDSNLTICREMSRKTIWWALALVSISIPLTPRCLRINSGSITWSRKGSKTENVDSLRLRTQSLVSTERTLWVTIQKWDLPMNRTLLPMWVVLRGREDPNRSRMRMRSRRNIRSSSCTLTTLNSIGSTVQLVA